MIGNNLYKPEQEAGLKNGRGLIMCWIADDHMTDVVFVVWLDLQKLQGVLFGI